MAFGLYWVLTSFGLLPWIGGLMMLIGAALAADGALRLARPPDGGGAGVVAVSERQITYLSGTGGGAVSLDRLSRVAVSHAVGRAPVWLLVDGEGNRIAVPADAEGAQQVFDALSPLPGLGQATLLRAMRDTAPGTRDLWSRGPRRLG